MPEAKVRDASGREVTLSVVMRLMDSRLREELCRSGAYADDQAFFEAYAQAHVRKFSQSFAPFTGGRW